MRFARFTIGLTASLLLSVAAVAQQLDDRQIIKSLGELEGAAPAVDLAILTQDLTTNVGHGVSQLPNWNQLATLPQFAVEIDLEPDSVAIEPKSCRDVWRECPMPCIAQELLPYLFLVVGHSSSTGAAEHNLKLSAQRAAAIAEP